MNGVRGDKNVNENIIQCNGTLQGYGVSSNTAALGFIRSVVTVITNVYGRVHPNLFPKTYNSLS